MVRTGDGGVSGESGRVSQPGVQVLGTVGWGPGMEEQMGVHVPGLGGPGWWVGVQGQAMQGTQECRPGGVQGWRSPGCRQRLRPEVEGPGDLEAEVSGDLRCREG